MSKAGWGLKKSNQDKERSNTLSIETGATVILHHNALHQLAAIVSSQGTLHTNQFPSSYGPQSNPSIPSDLLTYAQSLSWHSQSQDPTGLIWMGARYYDPKGGRFLSPDPVGYPLCLDLYVYAGGDPVNYSDPDGRFFSPVYQSLQPVFIGTFQPFNGFNTAVRHFNHLPATLANHGLTRSGSYEIGSFDLPCGAIDWINGIDNQRTDSIATAQQLSRYAGGAKIYGIYNATNWDSSRAVSIGIDVLECSLGHLGIHTPSVQLLKNRWNHFIATRGPEEKLLQLSSSGGSLHVYNALITSSESVRQRIISLALAPAKIIPKKLCYESYNYVSRRDFIPHLDIMGKLRYGNQLQVLEPHPDAKFFDHNILSPTFAPKLKDHIEDYIKNYGSKK
ncbi:MAG TPA: RHS repeat-associated core domain-containing protein [Rhabdochlamydiaceae bacterium]|nr:RHS repeat-associated core domain-containing protein [Rhabdochlamydiaceae bacterium]